MIVVCLVSYMFYIIYQGHWLEKLETLKPNDGVQNVAGTKISRLYSKLDYFHSLSFISSLN